MEALNKVEKELQKYPSQEEDYWKQRAKLFWLQVGDLNTKAFHQFAIGRWKQNSITRLKDEHAERKEKGSGIEQVVLSYFRNLFCSKVGKIKAVL